MLASVFAVRSTPARGGRNLMPNLASQGEHRGLLASYRHVSRRLRLRAAIVLLASLGIAVGISSCGSTQSTSSDAGTGVGGISGRGGTGGGAAGTGGGGTGIATGGSS